MRDDVLCWRFTWKKKALKESTKTGGSVIYRAQREYKGTGRGDGGAGLATFFFQLLGERIIGRVKSGECGRGS